MLPNYLVIGAARCGTTWLAKNLGEHPEIFMHSKKELHFFDKDYNKGIEWYEKKFNNARENVKAVGEATPAYMDNADIATQIKKHMPYVKLIVSLRDPVERAYSHYLYRERERQLENKPLTFEEKIEATPSLIEAGLYADKLKNYYQLFPRENIIIILYDELINDPKKYLKRVYEFLGVDTKFISPALENEINSSSGKPGKFHVFHLLDRLLLKAGLFRVARMVTKFNKKTGSESVTVQTRKMLLEKYFLDDIEKLEAMTGMDLSKWKQI